MVSLLITFICCTFNNNTIFAKLFASFVVNYSNSAGYRSHNVLFDNENNLFINYVAYANVVNDYFYVKDYNILLQQSFSKLFLDN